MTTENTAITTEDTFNQAASMTIYNSTFNQDDKAGKIQVINAFNDAVSLNDHMGEVIQLANVIQTSGVRKGRNGMPDTECVNTYLVDADGQAYFSQSDGVAKSVNMIVQAFDDLATDPLAVACTAQELANGNTIKRITIVTD